ncbi:MAG: beta-lactamase family protein [Firmicutes bacterium]|nr:beta-lactamase family protein [Bacillota bacterium]
MNITNLEKIWQDWQNRSKFSGVFSIRGPLGVIFEKCGGYRNRSEELVNNVDTAFGIASGTKLFTGLAVCKLIDDKKISLQDKLCDILSYDLGQIDRDVTVRHLLTHTSGVGDYIDEEDDECTEKLKALYDKYPVYLWERLEYYLQMITPLPPKFKPGTRYSYSNSGFVLLGLVVEAASGLSYQQYVTDNIVKPCSLVRTGFYRMDSLPANTAYGYMKDDETGEWHTNIFSLPVLGGSDGGIFTCAEDIHKLWNAIASNVILSEEMTQTFLKSQISTNFGSEDDDDNDDDNDDVNNTDDNTVLVGDGYYGLGVYLFCNKDGEVYYYYAVGGDSGVDFVTAYFPKQKIVVSALGNTQLNLFPLLEAVEMEICKRGEMLWNT